MRNFTEQLRWINKNIEGWLSPHEGKLLFHLSRLSKGNRTIVEIGSWKGRSTAALALGIVASKNKGEVFSVDPHEGIIAEKKQIAGSTYQEFLLNIKRAHIHMHVTPLKKRSVDAAKSWKKPIDVLFLDGLHDEENTKTDYRSWEKYLSKTGILAFHDAFCGEEGVWNVIKSGPLLRNDVTDIGTAGSILYFILGKRSLFSSLRVRSKKFVLVVSNWLYRNSMLKPLSSLLIHRFLRIFLLTPQTLAVYTYHT